MRKHYGLWYALFDHNSSSSFFNESGIGTALSLALSASIATSADLLRSASSLSLDKRLLRSKASSGVNLRGGLGESIHRSPSSHLVGLGVKVGSRLGSEANFSAASIITWAVVLVTATAQAPRALTTLILRG